MSETKRPSGEAIAAALEAAQRTPAEASDVEQVERILCAGYRVDDVVLVSEGAAPDALRDAASQAWLPDTFIERAYRIARGSKHPVNEVVMLTFSEASAIRVHVPPGDRATGDTP